MKSARKSSKNPAKKAKPAASKRGKSGTAKPAPKRPRHPPKTEKRDSGPLAARIAVAVALSSLVGLVIKLLPGPSQVNWEILAFAVPVNLALAVALAHQARPSA